MKQQIIKIKRPSGCFSIPRIDSEVELWVDQENLHL